MVARNFFVEVADATRKSMLANRPTGTRPEMIVRRLAHAMGYRYRLHRRDIPGTPDLTFPSRRKVVFVHGCYWHRHGCRAWTTPKTRGEYWERKFRRNVERDEQAMAALTEAGWSALVIWECETARVDELRDRLSAFLDG